MTVGQADVENLHFEHTLWRNQLDFVADELKIFEKRLGKLVLTLRDREMLARLEHYQNQFIRQKEVLDQLQHDIKVHEQQIGIMLQNGKVPQDTDVSRHQKVGAEMKIYQKIYGELKEDFFRFMAENL